MVEESRLEKKRGRPDQWRPDMTISGRMGGIGGTTRKIAITDIVYKVMIIGKFDLYI